MPTVVFINQTQIREYLHERGFRCSPEYLRALDELVEVQLAGAVTISRGDKRKTCTRKLVTPLMPIGKGEIKEGR